jgi:hypothetical protein
MIEENNKKLELLIKDSQKSPKDTKEFLTTKVVFDMFNTSRQLALQITCKRSL